MVKKPVKQLSPERRALISKLIEEFDIKSAKDIEDAFKEMFYGKDWNGVSIEDFMDSADAYILWYNTKRIKMSLGCLSPLEYRAKNLEDKTIA